MLKIIRLVLIGALLLAVMPLAAQESDPLDALTAAYTHPDFDPDEAAWTGLLDHPDYQDGELFVLEIVSFDPELEDASAGYEAYLDALFPAYEAAGGQIELVYDIFVEGTGDLNDLHGEAYRGGMAYTARFPSREAFVTALLDETVVEAIAARNAVVSEVQWMAGTDTLPPLFRSLPQRSAESMSTPLLDGKSTDELQAELEAIYPDGGADPTFETLRMLLEWEGFRDTPLYYINLYDWGEFGEEGAAAHDAYNQGAQPTVLQHGVSLTARVEIEHHLAGPVDWDRLILPRWPSFAVFTDLRLEPDYIVAQEDRVRSAEVYGSYITTARPVEEEAEPATDE